MRILAFGCACLLISFVRLTDSYGQPDLKNKKDVYNYWAQRCIIELIYSSIEDYPQELTEEELNGKQKYFDEFINGIDEKDITEISRDFNYVEEFLTNNSYKVTANNYFRPLKEAFEQKKSFDSEFLKVPNYYETSKSWEKKKGELLLAYSQSMQNVSHINIWNSKTERNTSISLPQQSSKNTLPLKWILLGFVAGIIIGAYSIYLCFRSKIYSILRKEKHEYLDTLKQNLKNRSYSKKSFKFIGIVEVLKQSKDQKKKDLDECKKEIVKLKRENSDLNKEKHESEGNAQIVSGKNKDSLIENAIDQNEKLIVINKESSELFFTIPDRDGSFKIINARYNKEKDCFYKLSVDSSGQGGKLYFLSGEYDMRALDNIDYYLNPVCEIQNITNRTYARKIEMLDPGTVIKMGDIWRIENNNKVKVKLV